MQTKYLHKAAYQVLKIDETDYSVLVYERLKKIESYDKLMQDGGEEDTVLEALETSRAALYRWKKGYRTFGLAGLENASKRPNNVRKPVWTRTIEERVYHLRKKFPLWGKAKIAVKYKAHYNEIISVSMVGRILSKLVQQQRVMPVRFLLYAKRDVKKREFNRHAQRWRYGMKATKPGELVQIDHMTITVPGHGQLKHFSAVCPVTKYAAYQVYHEANSKNARDFLEHVRKTFPFQLISLQVDGGGEFMGYFEDAAADYNLPLFVLPPRSPEYNGNVERANGTAKYEFYAQYEASSSFHILRKDLQKFAHFHNSVRPHQGIDLLTPSQFFEVIKKRTLQSHMY